MNIRDIERAMEEFNKGNQEAHNSLLGYLGTLERIRDAHKQMRTTQKALTKIQEKINQLQNRAGVNGTNLTAEQTRQLRALQAQVPVLENIIESHRLQRDLHKRNLTLTNAISASLKTTSGTLINIGKSISNNHKYWTDNMKAVRTSEKSMGVLSTQTEVYRQNLYQASFFAADLGYHLSDLVDMQLAYSEGLGRTISLRQDEIALMSGVAAGSNQSLQDIGELTQEMANLGINTERATNFFNKLGIDARKKGLVTSKVFEKFNTLLKEGNKYQFKGGIEGMQKLVMLSEKFKLELDTVAGFSDKVFDIEGAIEMGAQLQVLGGEWAQISDPMQLMFKARNDMTGLGEDIVKAASNMATFNENTEAFEIPSLQLARMKGLAEFSGMSVDQLKDLAIQAKKVSQISLEMDSSVPDDIREFVTSTAKFGKDGITVDFNGKTIPVKQLGGYVSELRAVLTDKQTFEEKAKMAQLFDERIDNLFIKAKTILYPLVESLDRNIEPLLSGMVDWINKNSKVILETIKTTTGYIKNIFDWMYDNPIESGIIGAIALFGDKILAPALWLANGITLGQGFNMATDRALGNSTSLINPSAKGALAGAGLGALGLGTDYLKDVLIENGTIEAGGLADNGMGYGAAALEGAGTGAMFGAMFGPQGALIGGALGALAGAGFHAYTKNGTNQISNDFISRPGSDPINFNSADTLIGLKKDGGLGKALLNQAGVGPGSASSSGSVTLSPLTVNGEIKLNMGNGVSEKLNLNDPIVIRELARLVQEQLNTELAGKRTNNPIS